jgi:NitT/TauT family transport system permease protein
MDPVLQAFLGSLGQASVDMSLSMVRMCVAYALSLAFAIIYGYFAATNRIAEKILLPILDILQSVPILGFFPIVIIVFIDAFGNASLIGPNLASIILIFTSMSWNMAFGVYESIKTLPGELREVSDSFDVHGVRRLRRLLLPSTVNRLVYNSILSWSVGWYFLVSAEMIATGATNTVLPGIGSYLLTYAATTPLNTGAMLAGIFVLVLVIVLQNFFLWRPLSSWAEKYRYDTAPSGEGGEQGKTPFRRMSGVVNRAYSAGLSMVKVVRHPLARLGIRRGGGSIHTSMPGERAPRRHRLFMFMTRYLALGGILVVAWLMVIALGVGIFTLYTQPVTPPVMHYMDLIPEALGLSAFHLVLAYLLSLAIAIPLAVYIYRHATAARYGLPVIQIIAAVPATALFPLFLFSLKDYIGSDATVVFVLLTGMLWYLFFNILSGLRSIPPDLEEASRSMGLKGYKYYRRLVFPAIFSSFVTGSITAMGGGWNTLIIAEYINYRSHVFSTLGIGQLIDIGTYPISMGGLGGVGEAGEALMVAAVLVLVVTVVIVNRVIWKPLYRLSTDRYRYD